MQDTFRGRVCECPLVNGVQFSGDGYSLCKRKSFIFWVVSHILMIPISFLILTNNFVIVYAGWKFLSSDQLTIQKSSVELMFAVTKYICIIPSVQL